MRTPFSFPLFVIMTSSEQLPENTTRPHILVVQAIEDETFDWQPAGLTLTRVLTGVGKANMALHLTEAIMTYRPDAVLNVGTAGTVVHHVGDILVCDRFVDRDLQPLAIHGLVSELTTADVSCLPLMSSLQGKAVPDRFVVNTGDSFVTQHVGIDGDAIDMEAFAAAAVSRHFGIPFLTVKYITDIIGQNSIRHWEEKLAQARAGLQAYFSAYDI